ncbi:MAG TPA: transcriptional regulator, partial [Porphyromonadaceae bacterium]|nr:transcriptional regulator [Porphyromonadaceae bacterium]
ELRCIGSSFPFMVTIEPKGEDEPMHLNSHAGQEFNYIVEGRVIVRVGGKDLILEAGDSIYFNSALPHGLKALDGRNVTMLAIIF